jgi:ABC-2 type transport system permease protein/lipopolysaccharide transport system permease protein
MTTETLSQARRRFAGLAMRDIIDGLKRTELWGTLGWVDVRQRYRRSVIGPFWITISIGMLVAGLGVVYATLFKQDLRTYLPFVAVGIIVWNLISALLTDGAMAFISAEYTIKQIPFPLTIYIYREVWRNLIVFAHNMIIYVLILLIFGINPGFGVLWAIPALALVLANGLGFAAILGILSARFRDIPPLITNFVQLVFFVTPILWQKEILQQREWIAALNPFAYLIEIVRKPLLGQPVPLNSWLIVCGCTALNLVIATLFYRRYRWRIPYWM